MNFVALSFILFFSCSKPITPNLAPNERVKQVYFLSSQANGDCNFPFISFPKEQLFLEKYKKRLYISVSEDKEKLVETLKIWNARPIDYLFISGALAKKTYEDLKLPKVKDRKVVYLGFQGREDAVGVMPDFSVIPSILSFFNEHNTSLAVEPKNCFEYGAASKVKNALVAGDYAATYSESKLISVVVDFKELFIAIDKASKNRVMTIAPSVKNNLLKVNYNKMSRKSDPEVFKFFKLWKLNQL